MEKLEIEIEIEGKSLKILKIEENQGISIHTQISFCRPYEYAIQASDLLSFKNIIGKNPF